MHEVSAAYPVLFREIPGDWSIQPIQALCLRVTSGGTPFRGNPAFYEGGTIPWFKTQELAGWYLDDSEEHITELALAESSAKIFPVNTVLMAMYGDGRTITSLGILRRPAASNQACCALIADPEICDYRYLFYALKYHRVDFIRLASGGAQRNLSGTLVRNFAIRVPPLWEQRDIGKVLGALDDKVELNRHMNQTLEAMAGAIFKSWFMDFDPARDGGEPFHASAIGDVPSGWSVKAVSEAFELNPSRPLRAGCSAPYLDMASMPTQSARALAWTYREFGSGMRFMNGDVLVARITPCLENGKTAFVDFLEEGQVGWGSTEYIVLKSKPPLPAEYAYFLARSETFRLYAISNMVGTTGRQRVPVSCFDSLKVAVPPKALAMKFGEFASGVFAALKQRDEESQTLTSLRDALLPKLLSGEIRIKQAEKIVGEVA